MYKSPLVQPPDSMPDLKYWFGDWNEQQVVSKKDGDTSGNSAGARGARFRRDPEDGDAPRSFRSTLTQPSQMGNFRHQSLRTTERDKDRDSERERERDLRDKEGQERLRNLSDKYDRERLALASSTNSLRNKERDSAPHLASGTTSRLGQAQSSSTSRRNEGRDPAKRKVGETSEDWRKGSDPSRAGRDDRSDNARRGERPRSRVRESSRPRREPSSSRRDRDERDWDRPRDRRGDDESRRDSDFVRRDRDETYRDRDDHFPRGDRYRPKDTERDSEDDPRRWRDDGRRDERMAARREQRPWERTDERDRERPSASDDRDSRPRRGAARDRRLGGDDGKDREDRRERDRDRDREKEAEPAWMETYIPPSSGGGILGGKAGDGELDGIQAWKKGMKEKERMEKENAAGIDATKKPDATTPGTLAPSSSAQASSAPAESQLDEIQLFKLMMKREAEKEGGKPPNGQPEIVGPTSAALGGSSVAASEAGKLHSPTRDPSLAEATAIVQAQLDESAKRAASRDVLPHASDGRSTAAAPNGSQSLLSALIASSSSESSLPANAAKPTTPTLEQTIGGSRVLTSRALGNPSPAAISPSATQLSDMSLDSSATNAPSPSAFNPPAGSRLLAFASRASSGASTDAILTKNHPGLEPNGPFAPPGAPTHRLASIPPSLSANAGLVPDPVAGLGGEPHYAANSRHLPAESSRVLRSYSPHANLAPSSASFDELHDGVSLSLSQYNELRRERAALGIPNDSGAQYVEPNAANYSPSSSLDFGGNVPGGYAAGKGSRFAKFWDNNKPRDGPPVGARKVSGGPSFPPTQPEPRQGALNGVNGDARAMEDIFAMLQNSAQTHRMSPQLPPTSGRIPGGNSFGQNHDLHSIQQMQPQQHFAQNNHLDSLYDSRLDDRNFVPDGMVPGLRPAPPRSRSREPSGVLFNEQIDDPLHFNVRLQQQRNLEQLYGGGPSPSMYTQQQAAMLRNGGIPVQQQQQFRGASPIGNQNGLGGPSQRLPPGLANLGGRPPHDPSQYLGGPLGGLGGGLQGGLPGGAPLQQGYSGSFNGGGLGFGAPQVRGPPGAQTPLGLNSMANLGLQSTVDIRAANQAQLLGLGAGGMGAGMRGQGPGFGPQHGPSGQLPASHMALRQQQQQQQQQLPPHLLPHVLPHHLQQQQGLPGGNSQGAQDLMALLMGGHRD
ncbi:hypothetical protein WOLCODRAFT_135191 [Wolfiporia cocos MD-104 SS10]|uniref:Uncharacterized protein n=1 Tax=Wolfiporia cocos (strain MD-104) TaxID=742152 RepID=A0A2H3IUB5_WOLCO|nr:hypothetical protein WOLCODRAFT_135191 [Wolfiporia cocos MD-104 SS10]